MINETTDDDIKNSQERLFNIMFVYFFCNSTGKNLNKCKTILSRI